LLLGRLKSEVPKVLLDPKMAGTAWYFAYASNMNRAQMRSRAGELLEERPGRLENYELVFNKKVRGGTANANIRPVPGEAVEGVLYRINESSFRALDRAEGAPQHYRRIEVEVRDANGETVAAQAFIATKVEKGLRPASHYLKTILDGAAEHNLPAAYIEKIQAAAAAG
jgi:gamma-glutamylcyclotransferase